MFVKIKEVLHSGTVKDTLASMVGSGGIALGGLLFTVIAARSLAPDKFGIFSALLALATIIVGLGDLGISSALINFIPKVKNDRNAIVSIAFWFQLFISVFAASLIIILSIFHQKIIPGSLPLQFVLIGFLGAIYILESFTQSILNAERKFIITSILQITDSFGKLSVLAYLFFTGRVTIELAILASISSAFIATLIGLSREFSHISTFFPKHHLSQIFHFSKWVALTRLFSVMVSRIDTILLVSMASSFQAGIFSAASRIALLFSLIASTLGSVISPRFSSFTSKNEIVTYLKKTSLLITLVAVFMLLTIVFARPIIELVFGSKYQDSIIVFQFLGVAMIPFLYTALTVNPLIYSFGRPDFIAYSTIVQVVLLIVLDILLIPRLGAIAPTMSMGISNMVVLALTGYKLSTLLRS